MRRLSPIILTQDLRDTNIFNILLFGFELIFFEDFIKSYINFKLEFNARKKFETRRIKWPEKIKKKQICNKFFTVYFWKKMLI